MLNKMATNDLHEMLKMRVEKPVGAKVKKILVGMYLSVTSQDGFFTM